MNAKEAKEAVAKYGSQRAAERALGVGTGTICRLLKGAGAANKTPPSEKSGARTKGVKTLADFRQAYDKDTIIPARVKAGLSALGADGWEYEVEFAKMCGVSLYDLGHVREKFSDHVVAIGRNTKRAWAGSKALAAKMREMV